MVCFDRVNINPAGKKFGPSDAVQYLFILFCWKDQHEPWGIHSDWIGTLSKNFLYLLGLA